MMIKVTRTCPNGVPAAAPTSLCFTSVLLAALKTMRWVGVGYRVTVEHVHQ